MSLLWRNRLRIALAPDKVVAVLLGHGRSPAVEKKSVWICKPEQADAHPWQAAVRALSAGLREIESAGLQASFVLSNHFVRYTLLPWSDEVTRDDERQTLARISFEKHFGSHVNHWSIRLSDEEYGKASLASAVDASLPEAILQACEVARLRAVSIEPYLMSVFNHYRRRLTGENICVAIVESQKIGLLMARAGQWYAVRVLPIKRPLADELGPLIKRETLLAGLPTPARVYLHAPAEGGLSLLEDNEIHTELLELSAYPGFSPRADSAYGMAMSGAF